MQTIGNIVAADYRTAAIFSKYGIDFCCKGNRGLDEVCAEKNIDLAAIQAELENAVATGSANNFPYQTLPSDLLLDIILKKFHRDIRERTPLIITYLEKVCKAHGHAYPEVYQIYHLFAESARDLAHHMHKEEEILFPYILQLIQGEIAENAPFAGNVAAPIQMMHHEHNVEGERFRKIAELTKNYTPPAGACNTFRVSYAMLQEFESDLHLHIHLENNILFPKALELERKGTLVG